MAESGDKLSIIAPHATSQLPARQCSPQTALYRPRRLGFPLHGERSNAPRSSVLSTNLKPRLLPARKRTRGSSKSTSASPASRFPASATASPSKARTTTSDFAPTHSQHTSPFLKRVRSDLGEWRIDELIKDIETLENWINDLIPGETIPCRPGRPASKRQSYTSKPSSISCSNAR
jgi:hypothetical protein